MPSFQITKNLSIFGPPGSGKGSYGRLLAAAWNIPLKTASTILRNSNLTALDLDSGALVECKTVSEILRHHLVEEDTRHFILDGYPRTLQQIHLMEAEWPVDHRVNAVVQLHVPDDVCIQKILGRRTCRICKKEVNVAAVHTAGFDLPPQVPACAKCDPQMDWVRRKDDTESILAERIRLHREHEDPILEYYSSKGRLFRFTPFTGYKVLPRMQAELEEWLVQLKEN